MCGIIGMAGDLGHKNNAMFNDMLLFCQVRGKDSAGVFSVRNGKGNFDYVKQVGTPENLWGMKKYDNIINGYASRAMIGHCRAKTVGEVSRHTAHPFHEGPIIGVHNGTLRNWHKLPEARDFSVDSNALFYALSVVENPVEVLEELEGAYALIWYDARTDLLYLARNKERPLLYAWSKDKRQIFWASESWMIEIAAMRAEIPLWANDEGYEFFHVPSGRLIGLQLSSSGATPIQMVRDEEFKIKESSFTSYTSGGFGGHRQAAPPKPPVVVNPPAQGGQVLPFARPQEQQAPPASKTTLTLSKASQSQQKDSPNSSTSTSPASKSTKSLVPTNNEAGSAEPKSFWEHLNAMGVQEDESSEGEPVVALFENEVRARGEIVNELRFLELVEDGCQWCQKSIDFQDEKAGKGVGMWLPHGFICVACTPSAIEVQSMRKLAQ